MAGGTKHKAIESPPKTMRASITFPTEVYEELERIAHTKKVSLAWVVREAAEKYVAEQWPLFGETMSKENARERR